MNNYLGGQSRLLHANISVLVLFLLIVSSLIGLMTVSYVRQMVAYNSSISQYYKAYYMARAGLELGVVSVQQKGLGYEATISSGDSLIESNTFSCPGRNCVIASHIEAMSTGLSIKGQRQGECTSGIAYTLGSEESLIIPLFADTSKSFDGPYKEESITNIYVSPSIRLEFLDPQPRMVGVGFSPGLVASGQKPQESVTDEDLMYTVVSGTNDFSTAINNFIVDKKKFSHQNNILVITNPLVPGEPIQGSMQFCLSSASQELPMSLVTITSWGQVGDRQVGLQGIKNIALPDYLLQTYISR